MLYYLFKLHLKLMGWKAVSTVPPDLKKFIMVVAPHTSSWDVYMGFAFRSILKLNYVKFIGKQELFKLFIVVNILHLHADMMTLQITRIQLAQGKRKNRSG